MIRFYTATMTEEFEAEKLKFVGGKTEMEAEVYKWTHETYINIFMFMNSN